MVKTRASPILYCIIVTICIVLRKEIIKMFGELNNYVRTVKEGVNTRELDFKSLKDFAGKEIKVDGFFFTTGDYGKQVVVVGNGYNINMPVRAVEQFEKIYNNECMLEALLNGHLIITDIAEIKAKNGKTASYTLKDC